MSLEAIKSQMRTLFAKFAIEDLPQNEKRGRLAELAMHSGAISPRSR